jgi:hypothetical protein
MKDYAHVPFIVGLLEQLIPREILAQALGHTPPEYERRKAARDWSTGDDEAIYVAARAWDLDCGKLPARVGSRPHTTWGRLALRFGGRVQLCRLLGIKEGTLSCRWSLAIPAHAEPLVQQVLIHAALEQELAIVAGKLVDRNAPR